MTKALPATVLLINPQAGSRAEQRTVSEKLPSAFPRAPVIGFKPRLKIRELVRPGGRIIVAGGDGTIGTVARSLAGSDVTLGVVPLGTYNNFARALDLPIEVEAAIAALKVARPRGITLGCVGDHIFLEAAALGVFGAAIVLGESAKEMAFGHLPDRLRELTAAREFDFELSGDIAGEGRALSLVFANTPSTGAGLQLANKRPTMPHLELSVQVGRTRTDIVRRAIQAVAGVESASPMINLRFRRLEITTSPRVAVYADNRKVGRTPVLVSARPNALRVLLPEPGQPSP